MDDPTTDMVFVVGATDCTGDCGRDEIDGVVLVLVLVFADSPPSGRETDVITMCGILYRSWSTWIACEREAESVILTSERSLGGTRC